MDQRVLVFQQAIIHTNWMFLVWLYHKLKELHEHRGNMSMSLFDIFLIQQYPKVEL